MIPKLSCLWTQKREVVSKREDGKNASLLPGGHQKEMHIRLLDIEDHSGSLSKADSQNACLELVQGLKC